MLNNFGGIKIGKVENGKIKPANGKVKQVPKFELLIRDPEYLLGAVAFLINLAKELRN